MKNKIVFIFVCFLSFLSFGQEMIDSQISFTNGERITRYTPRQNDTWIIKYKNNKEKDKDTDKIIKQNKGQQKKLERLNLHILKSKNGKSIVNELRKKDSIIFAEPNLKVNIAGESNDPMFSNLWGLRKVQVPEAWNISTGSEIVIGILDSGIWCEHPDLIDNLWTDPISGQHGWTCLEGNLTEGVTDDHGHGTHCAGTIGAVGNNNLGVVGINWHVKLMGFKFISSTGGGMTEDAIILIDKIIELKQKGLNIRIINNSWGGGAYSQALEEAFNRLEENDILSIIASGNANWNIDISDFYPATYTNKAIISVMATDENDVKAYFSDYGLVNVDIAAPGTSILSTVPTNTNAPMGNSSGYTYSSGTSMATPHVVGLAGLILSRNRSLTALQLKDLILDPKSYDKLTDPQARLSTTGGRINAYKCLTNPNIFSPITNRNPEITLFCPSQVYGGEDLSISVIASDPDNDVLNFQLYSVDGLIQIIQTNKLSIKAPVYAMDVVSTVIAACSDGRGGSSLKKQYINILSPIHYSKSILVVSNYVENELTNGIFRSIVCRIPPSDNIEGSYNVNVSYRNGLDIIESVNYKLYEGCNYLSNGYLYDSFRRPVFCMYGIAENLEKILARTPNKYVNAMTNFMAMELKLRLSNNIGFAPLTVFYDLNDSVFPNGPITYNYVINRSGQMLTYTNSTQGSFVINESGTHRIMVIASDVSGFMSSALGYVTVYSIPSEKVDSPKNLKYTISEEE